VGHPPCRRAFWLTLDAEQYRIKCVIKSFRCAETGRLHRRQPSRRFEAIERIARRKLRQLDSHRIARSGGAAWKPSGSLARRAEGAAQYSN
jgi:hypothetical protein